MSHWPKNQGIIKTASELYSFIKAFDRYVSLTFLASRCCRHSLVCGSLPPSSEPAKVNRVLLTYKHSRLLQSHIPSDLTVSFFYSYELFCFIGPMWKFKLIFPSQFQLMCILNFTVTLIPSWHVTTYSQYLGSRTWISLGVIILLFMSAIYLKLIFHKVYSTCCKILLYSSIFINSVNFISDY